MISIKFTLKLSSIKVSNKAIGAHDGNYTAQV